MVNRIVFAYEHRYRVVDEPTVRQTLEGHTIITGIDPDKGEYRSFRVDRIVGGIRNVDVPSPRRPG